MATAIVSMTGTAVARDDGWYNQGDFEPTSRLALTVSSSFDLDRPDSPVIVRFNEFPVREIAEMLVTVVDPSVPPAPSPTRNERARGRPHLLQEESNGHANFHQLDDLDLGIGSCWMEAVVSGQRGRVCEAQGTAWSVLEEKE